MGDCVFVGIPVVVAVAAGDAVVEATAVCWAVGLKLAVGLTLTGAATTVDDAGRAASLSTDGERVPVDVPVCAAATLLCDMKAGGSSNTVYSRTR